MQSITTKYLPATDTKGSRIKATASGGGGSVTVGYRDELNTDQNHVEAAKALCSKMGWHGKLAYGSAPCGWGIVFVFLHEHLIVEV